MKRDEARLGASAVPRKLGDSQICVRPATANIEARTRVASGSVGALVSGMVASPGTRSTPRRITAMPPVQPMRKSNKFPADPRPAISTSGFQRALDHIRSVSETEARKCRLFESVGENE